MSNVKVLFGTYWFGSLPRDARQEFLDILKAHNVKDLDTAFEYVRRAGSSIENRI